MFGLFKKRPEMEQMFADGNWRLSQGQYNGDPIIVRINSNLSPFVGKSDYTLKIGFAIPLRNPRPGEMPTPEENDAIGRIEDQIFDAIRVKGSAVQALAITMGTFKEFVYYTKPDIDVASIHKGLMASIKSHEVQCIARIEENWDTYRKWADC